MKTNKIIQGDALEELQRLEDQSINMCMTSPPYWALRDYGVEGQLGLEPTFNEYINKLCDIFDEVKRVLRDDGTCWVNIGDTYYGSGKGAGGDPDKSKESSQMPTDWKRPSRDNYDKMSASKECLFCGKEIKKGITSQFCNHTCLNKMGNDFRSQNRQLPDKCLTMIPMRFAIEMVNRGWILRNTIIWRKRNCMPSSVKDRFTIDFEYVFFFSKKKKYYFEDQREGHKEYFKDVSTVKSFGGSSHVGGNIANRKDRPIVHTIGRNKRTVWTINPRPFSEAHFAVYPEELCVTPIKAGCPEFVCKKCGNPKVMDIEREVIHNRINKRKDANVRLDSLERIPSDWKPKEEKFKGFKPTCSCNVEFTGGIVLDPFFGAGTTGVVALKQSKKFIGIELNKEYIEIANKRLKPHLEQRKL